MVSLMTEETWEVAREMRARGADITTITNTAIFLRHPGMGLEMMDYIRENPSVTADEICEKAVEMAEARISQTRK